MTRVRRQISEMRKETEVSGAELPDASFSPVLKFDKPACAEEKNKIENNPADNFLDESYQPVDISQMVDLGEDADAGQRELSASIRHMINNKEDDLLAEYYFKDGISDLERYRLAQSYAQLYGEEPQEEKSDRNPGENEGEKEEMSDAAKRLSQFPEEKGMDKILTTMWEKYDDAVLKGKRFLRRNILDRLRRLYHRFDAKTAGFIDGILDKVYYRRFGSMKRKRAEAGNARYLLRRKVWCAVGAVMAVAFVGLMLVNMMMANDLNGEWIVSTDAGGSPNIIMQFRPGGRAMISVKSADGWHVHKQGKYSTKRRNGHDMLTIQYEDGDVKRLYYIIDGDTGTFINVDTNIQVEYKRK